MIVQPLLIRADASVEIGHGHVMRCLALAQAWQDHGGEVVFLCSESLPSALHERLDSERIRVRLRPGESGNSGDSQDLIDLAAKLGTTLVVVDGYTFGSEYQLALKDAGLHVLFIDDNGHADHYYADWVLNQNIHANESLYSDSEGSTHLLLGTRYTLIRREFWTWRGWKRTIPCITQNILVTMGGGDSNNVTLSVLQAIESVVDTCSTKIKVAVGGGNPHLSSLNSFAIDSGLDIEFAPNVTNMPDLMVWADIAVSSGGSTIWELCLMGMPTLAITTADNQEAQVSSLAAREILCPTSLQDLPAFLTEIRENWPRRQRMSALAHDLVDGFGANRVAMFLRRERLWLRDATLDDCELVWHWANDLDIRLASFSTEQIPWETHQEWYRTAIENDRLLMFIAVDQQEKAIGQIRYSIEGDSATVSISLDPSSRGVGYGSELLGLGSDRLFSTTAVVVQHAYIKLDNVASQRAFERAGFRKIAETLVSGQPAFRYERRLVS